MQRGGGDYFLVKFMGWDFVHVCKNEQGGFVRGGGGGGDYVRIPWGEGNQDDLATRF